VGRARVTKLARPFAALRPRPTTAQAVIAPPYDVVDTEEARALAAGKPHSFLHVSRPEIDFPPSTDPHDDRVYARGAANLAALVSSGILEREASRCYYAYRMRMGEHVGTGFAFAASIRAYEENRIRKHELTRPDKEADRVRNIESLNAQTGPVLCAFRGNATLDDLLRRAAAGPPLLEAQGPNSVAHTIWRIDDGALIEAVGSALDALGALYIADGHHRSAAAARVAAARRNRSGATSDAEASEEFFLCVAFPSAVMRIYDYNRVVLDLNGLDVDDFLRRIAREFTVTRAADRVAPTAARIFGLYVGGHWYRLEARTAEASADPVERLDVSLLQRALIGPVLEIRDPRTDPRIEFVGGIRGLEALEQRVDSGRAAAALTLHPTSMDELMAVADAGRLMPPKSTWFEPKLADGLLSHVLD
jgi:uncharacterized protein (DUF1015 family)